MVSEQEQYRGTTKGGTILVLKKTNLLNLIEDHLNKKIF